MLNSMKVRARIVLAVCMIAGIVFSIAIATITVQSKNMAEKNAYELMQNEATKNSTKIATNLEVALNATRTMSESIKGMKDRGMTDRRVITGMLEQILADNPDFIGVWTCWEPNAFDGRDQEYQNTPGHDVTGRFVPYVYRSDGKPSVTPLTDYTKAGAGDYYLLARNSGRETILEPYHYMVGNKDVLITSLVTPIKIDGVVVGVAGIDISLDKLKELASSIKLFDHGYGYILSNTGIIVTHPDTKMIGTDMTKRSDINYIQETTKAIRSGSLYSVNDYSAVTKTVAHKIFVPIHVGNTITPWSLAIIVPMNEVLADVNRTMWLFIILGVVSLFIFAGSIWVVAGGIVKPIRGLSEHAKILATGDWTIDLSEEYLHRKDEFGTLADSFDLMTRNIREMIQEIAKSAQEVAASSQELASFGEDIASSMQEVSASTEEIAASMQEVSASTQDIGVSGQAIGSALNQLNVDADKDREKALMVENRAMKVQQDALSAQQATRNLYGDIEVRLNSAIQGAQVVEQIAGLAQDIAEIADQTNLLALNAAIEAARAGEQGRGFAVVADEVRKLAESSSNTVSDIQNLTKQVNESIKNLVASSRSLLDFINDKVLPDYEYLNDVGQQYKEDSHITVALAEYIGKNVQDINISIREVNRLLETTAATIEQSALGSQEIARGSEQTTLGAMQVKTAAYKMSENAEKLNELISRFKC